jgi:Uma2 family endonuclease
MTATATFGQLLRNLGDIDPDRVLMPPAPGTATEADLLACPRKFVELVDGVLVEKTMGAHESHILFALAGLFHAYRMEHNPGVFGVADTLLQLAPGTIRLPDLSFTAYANLPSVNAHRKAVGKYAPDLAVEILSISDRPGEIKRRIADFFAAGTKLVWIFDPRKETVTVYTDPVTTVLLTNADTLDGGDVLPGFSFPLNMLFNDPMIRQNPEDEDGQ